MSPSWGTVYGQLPPAKAACACLEGNDDQCVMKITRLGYRRGLYSGGVREEGLPQMVNQWRHELVAPAAVLFDEYLAVSAAPPQENIITTL